MSILRLPASRLHRLAALGAAVIGLIAVYGAGASGAWAQSDDSAYSGAAYAGDVIGRKVTTDTDGMRIMTLTFSDHSTVSIVQGPPAARTSDRTDRVFSCGSAHQAVTSRGNRVWSYTGGDVVLSRFEGRWSAPGGIDMSGVAEASLPWTGMWAPGLDGQVRRHAPQKDCSRQ